jgi:hypothetical protein
VRSVAEKKKTVQYYTKPVFKQRLWLTALGEPPSRTALSSRNFQWKGIQALSINDNYQENNYRPYSRNR